MALKPISPRLRVINGTADVAKAAVTVAAGDVLDVPAEVGAQLLAARVGFREEGVTPTPPVPVEALPELSPEPEQDLRTDSEREADDNAAAARKTKRTRK